jgi:rhomboid protease GluP
MGPRAIDRRDPGQILGGLIPQARFTTIVILIINFALYGATWLYSQRTGVPYDYAVVLFGAKLGLRDMLRYHQMWRLITAGFLHGGVLHILMNSWVLFDLGAEVEAAYGTSRMVVFYFVSSVAGFFLSSLWSAAPSLGASAGIMGLIGAMIAFGVTERSALGQAVRSLYIRWVVYILVLGLLPGLHIDNAAHIGGLAAGFALGYVLSPPRARLLWREPLIRGAAIASVLLTVGAFGLMVLSLMAVQAQPGA